ncbi:potassium channel family protein [Rhodococcus sp. NPDC127530]|uniref:potassium channel family protein n=1 Tax=unclassified Rhodococcus (in: high G+C Gram-positive bacteria) TaxID=192944 RepID=UPI00362AA23C
MTDSYLVIGETTVARRVCASLRERDFRVRHLIAPDDDELRQAMADQPSGMAVLVRDDVVALRYALAAAHISATIPLVVSIFDRTVADQLSELLPQCDVTSPADLAAPTLAGPCLEPGLVSARHDGAHMLAVRMVDGHPESALVDMPRNAWWHRALTGATGLLRSHDFGTRMLLGGLAGLLAVLMTDWAWLVLGRHVRPLDAFNEAVRVVTTVGPGVDAHDSPAYAVFASLAMLFTVVFTAMFTAGIVDRLLGPRRVALIGRRVLPRTGHVIVVGLGQVGLRLCRELQALGIPVVGVERNPAAKNLRLVRTMNIPTVVGHGGDRELLERLGVHRALALAAVGSDDLDNIAVSVAAQAVSPGLRLVLRAGEQEAIAETRSLLRLGSIRDVTSLSATYVVARLIGLQPRGVVSDGSNLFLEVTAADSPETGFTELPVSPRVSCRHVLSATEGVRALA